MFLSPQNKVFGSISSQFGMGRMDGKKKEGKDILYKNLKKKWKDNLSLLLHFPCTQTNSRSNETDLYLAVADSLLRNDIPNGLLIFYSLSS